jgi:hypothetical protein
MTHSIGAVLLAGGAALILLDLVAAASTKPSTTRIRLRMHRTLRSPSEGLTVVLTCVIGVGVIGLGLDLLTRT